MANKFNLERVKSNIQRVKAELPIIIANDTKNYFLKSFKEQGWEGKAWKEVKRRIPGTKDYKYPKTKDLGRRTRAILQGKGSGKLRGQVANSIRSQTFENITMVVGDNVTPYAEYLNNGTEKMPARKFMGDGKMLREMQRNKIIKVINKIWA